MTDYVNSALVDMSSYRATRKEVTAQITKLEKQIDQLRLSIVKPDMSKHIEACADELKSKKEAFLPALKKAVMTDEFTSQWQMRAISAFGQTKFVQTPADLFRLEGGAAVLAYMLTGQLDNKVLKIVIPHNDIFNYIHVLEDMCKQLGILNEELEDIALDIEFLTTLKNF
ncbi:hypothetical protein [Leclercia adecarboxylata]|uniref:hypothetical protein n=1 Tax=Leclercia adecarboxylata TaxID=83655 RepID=UPI00294A3435|nr:hypothetical protein [Leclercia adecarboxylata]MDV5280139.1 hypothetical protein [Leclercia adecarboxylata]MDV5464045.1 hypothetical protein [Leclercia adecarboxylata]MDV5505877.1 hypothetical protein [Leclercia adecarboxylata]MDV5534845.1 hypothetical protein [Leclercia adecarboxylata]MDV5593521.1 hypothetical protein [Leclercia adecarboxylata]